RRGLHFVVAPSDFVRYGRGYRRGHIRGHTTETDQMALHRLSTLKLKTTRPGRYADGGGLYLKVSRNPTTGEARRSWIFRFEHNGRERFMGLGSLNDVSLAEARERATAARRLHRDGQDPIEAREAARTARRLETARAMTFAQCAEAYVNAHKPAWRSTY